MPIYEYRCDNGHSFEAFQAMSDDPLDLCEVCDAPAQRVLHAPAVHFKGSGFYTTDYARKGANKAADNGGDSAKSKSDGGSAKSEGGSKGSSESGGSTTTSKSGSGASGD
jgi:putative FmdB family regulatory protein